MSLIMGVPLAGAGGGYPDTPVSCSAGCNAAVYDGTNDHMSANSNFPDTKVGTISFWFKMNGGDGVLQRFFDTLANRFSFVRQSGGKIQVLGKNAAATNILRMRSVTATYTSSATWHHLISSWDLAATTGWLYIDGVDEKDPAQPPILTNDTIDMTDTSDFVGDSVDLINASLSEFWFGNEFIADTVANREKFRNAAGEPVSLGADGSVPTGTAPIYYLNNGGPTFNTNKGTGVNPLSVVGGGLGDADGPGVP